LYSIKLIGLYSTPKLQVHGYRNVNIVQNISSKIMKLVSAHEHIRKYHIGL